MRLLMLVGTLAAILTGMVLTITPSAMRAPTILPVEERVLSEFTGVYQWEPNAFIYL